MKQKNLIIIVGIVALVAIVAMFLTSKTPKNISFIEVRPHYGEFTKKISATGSVVPENRVVVTAPINGRIDRILVEDGMTVKKKQILAWMSSQDRAALLDALQTSKDNNKGAQELAQMYKPTPIVAPEGGLIILKSVVRGQNISMDTTLFEISDRLIFVAKVDETDLGKISLKQNAKIRADAFPEQTLEAKIHHIAHQSTLNNNIITYDVMAEPVAKLPDNLRAGMSITMDFILSFKEKALLVPTFLAEGKQNTTVDLKIKGPKEGEIRLQSVELGLSNGEYSEVLKGLTENDVILYADPSVAPRDEPKPVLSLFGSKKK